MQAKAFAEPVHRNFLRGFGRHCVVIDIVVVCQKQGEQTRKKEFTNDESNTWQHGVSEQRVYCTSRLYRPLLLVALLGLVGFLSNESMHTRVHCMTFNDNIGVRL